MNKTYICIDLKSFYASVECIERNLDPMNTNLVVADNNRTEKTICLAVTPSLKSYGIPGRARLFEVIQKVRNVNYERKRNNGNKKFNGKSINIEELNNCKDLELDFIVAPPRMAYYMKYSTNIYNVYLKFFRFSLKKVSRMFCHIVESVYLCTRKRETTSFAIEFFERFHIRH